MIVERVTDPDSDGTSRYQFPPPIPMRGFATMEEMEIFDCAIYNICTGEKQPPPVQMTWRPMRTPLTEIEVEVITSNNTTENRYTYYHGPPSSP